MNKQWQTINNAPDTGEKVWTYWPNNPEGHKIILREPDGSWWRWQKQSNERHPTHWMPFERPEPPK